MEMKHNFMILLVILGVCSFEGNCDCTVNGGPGDGSAKGTCDKMLFCHADGSCRKGCTVSGDGNKRELGDGTTQGDCDKDSFCYQSGQCYKAQSLQCWDCHSDEHKDCSDTSTNEAIRCMRVHDTCSKVHINGKVQKGCAGVPNKPSGCKKRELAKGEHKDAYVENCYCHGDFCNSAGTYKIYPILIASFTLAPLLSSFLL